MRFYVFSSVQHAMGFRRVSSRHAPTVCAGVLLKLLAHNVRRLLAARLLCCVLVILEVSAPLDS